VKDKTEIEIRGHKNDSRLFQELWPTLPLKFPVVFVYFQTQVSRHSFTRIK
jgi:hypothetical protein